MNLGIACLTFLLLLPPMGDALADDPALTPTPPNQRLVGLAYTTWFTSTNWHDVWGVPQLGFYRSDDRAIIRQHVDWLVDAGVDFLFVDWSNNVDHAPGETRLPHQAFIEDATLTLFDELATLRRRPRIAIMLGTAGFPSAATDGRLQRKADQVWKTFADDPRYRPLLQEYLGKPLLIVYANTPSPYGAKLPWNDPRFTVRWTTGYVTEQHNLRTPELVSHAGYWSWEDRGAQTFAVHDGRPEAMTVVASWREDAHAKIPAAGRGNGSTFREQWARARVIGPQFALVVSWNEWVRGEQPSAEISKDLEPSREHGRLYLELLKEEVAKFKGHTASYEQ